MPGLKIGPGGITRGDQATRVVVQVIPDDTLTSIIFDTVAHNELGGFDLAEIPDRWTCTRAGWYAIVADVEWELNQTGKRRTARLIKNNAVLLAVHENEPGTTGIAFNNPSTLGRMLVGDYVQLKVFQDALTGGGDVGAGGGDLVTQLTSVLL